MIKRPLKNLAASVHQRLLNISKQSKRPFNELLQYYALERWLYRMSRSEYSERLVLKGALMLLVWDIPVTRPTRDIDLLGWLSNDLESIRSVIADVCRVPVVDDGMNYDPASVITERISAEVEYEGVRAKFQGYLGRARLPMQIDIGFSDIITPGPVEITYPSILGMPFAQIGAYNRETVIAEKFESMVKRGELNSRMRDFFDVWALATNSDFQGQTLADAIQKTFAQRDTEIETNPVCFTESFAHDASKNMQWKAFIHRGEIADAPAEFLDVVAYIKGFLQPIAIAIDRSAELPMWWKPGGPWQLPS
jgi:hypothetical protein